MGSKVDEVLLVTGAAGFIGSHLVGALLARGARVIGIDNFDPFYDVRIKRRNVERCLAGAGGERLEMVEADIADAPAVSRLFEKTRPVAVLHMAAKAGVRPSIEDPVGYARANLVGTASVMDAAHRHGCKRIVLASSSSVYGNNPKTPFSETDDVSGPISPYAASKRANELMAHAHHHLTRMPTACLRFFTVYGPGQRPDLAIGRFMRSTADGRAITMFGDGSSSRDYTYIDDIVTGVVAALDRIDSFGYRIWNLGGSEPVRLADLIAAVGRVVGREPRIEHAPMQPGDVERTCADLTRSGAELGFLPRTTLEPGLRNQWDWMKSNP